MKSIIIGIALIIAPLAVRASESIGVCDHAIEIAYKFIERAIEHQPLIAYTPVRTSTDSQLLRLACLRGIQHGKAKDSAELNAMYADIAVRARRPNIDPEYARYLVSDMAMTLSYKAGYIASVN